MFEKPPLKGYQEKALKEAKSRLSANPDKPLLVVGPCGCGKSRLMLEMAEWALASSRRSGVVTHRQMLTDQLCKDFEAGDVPHSVFAAGYEYDPAQPVTVMSAPSLFERCFRRGTHELPEADLLQIDEAHQQTGKQAQALIYGGVINNGLVNGYTFRGGSVVGYTATPVIKPGLYADMIEVGTYEDMRRERMHQLVKVFSPDEIDVSGLRANGSGDMSEKQLEKRVKGNNAIFGSVINEYKVLNPERLPAILFAPSVPSSMWFASSLCDEGIPAAHLCGKYIGWPNLLGPRGAKLEWCESTQSARDELLQAHRAGEVKVICNRFVLREAVNMPWCYHAIFATVMGGLSTYLQAVGRLQRYWPDYDYKILQCHGGHYWRHGSPNENRTWELGKTNRELGYARMEACAKGERLEGIRCPKCGGWRLRGPVCLHCGHAHTDSFRAVRQLGGRLKIQRGRVYTEAPPSEGQRSASTIWRRTLWGCAKAGRPFSSACSLFAIRAKEAGLKFEWSKLPNPPPLPSSRDYHRTVAEVYPWFARNKQPKRSKS